MADRTTFDGYSAEADKTAIYPSQGTNNGLLYTVLSLTGATGEVAGIVKGLIRDGVTAGSQDALVRSLGRALYALDRIADEIGAPLSTVAELNLDERLRAFDAGTLRDDD